MSGRGSELQVIAPRTLMQEYVRRSIAAATGFARPPIVDQDPGACRRLPEASPIRNESVPPVASATTASFTGASQSSSTRQKAFVFGPERQTPLASHRLSSQKSPIPSPLHCPPVVPQSASSVHAAPDTEQARSESLWSALAIHGQLSIVLRVRHWS